MSEDASRRRVRCRVVYRGRVQGVGFRYTCASIARRFPVTGYVRNLPDGTVELILDAFEEPAEAFLKEIDAAFDGYIDERRSEEHRLPEEFSGFGIRH